MRGKLYRPGTQLRWVGGGSKTGPAGAPDRWPPAHTFSGNSADKNEKFLPVIATNFRRRFEENFVPVLHPVARMALKKLGFIDVPGFYESPALTD